MVIARVSSDAMTLLLDMQFRQAWREDVMVSFLDPLSDRAVRELDHMPGVVYAEGVRTIPVRFVNDGRKRESVILGYPKIRRLRRVVDVDQREIPVPKNGVMLTTKLAEVLGVDVGQDVRVEMLEGDRRALSLTCLCARRRTVRSSRPHAHGRSRKAFGEKGTASMALLRIDPKEYAQDRTEAQRAPAHRRRASQANDHRPVQRADCRHDDGDVAHPDPLRRNDRGWRGVQQRPRRSIDAKPRPGEPARPWLPSYRDFRGAARRARYPSVVGNSRSGS